MRKEIIFWEEPQQVAHSTNKIISNSVKIERLQKKIEDLKNKWTWKQPFTHRRQRFLDWYTELIQEYERQIEELGGEVLEKRNFELERKIKWQLLKKIPWYFPTPMEVVRKMVELADLQPMDYILEPSCWTGNIIDWILEKTREVNIKGIEYNYSNYKISLEKYQNDYVRLENIDFMDYNNHWIFSKIIMNSPFENKQDQQHILKAFELLENWWTLVAICSSSATSRKDYQPLQDLISEYWERFDDKQYLSLDSWTFKMSGTMVNSILIVLKK